MVAKMGQGILMSELDNEPDKEKIFGVNDRKYV